MRPITEIIIHCTATRPLWMDGEATADKVDEVRRWHVYERGWSDIGYHYLIDRDGTIAEGRYIEDIGAHCRGHNAGSIGVALFGGHGADANDQFAMNFSRAQDHALRAFIRDMRAEHPDIRKISGHNQYSAKACPGFHVQRWHKANWIGADVA